MAPEWATPDPLQASGQQGVCGGAPSGGKAGRQTLAAAGRVAAAGAPPPPRAITCAITCDALACFMQRMRRRT
jgi:hypothetical protein